MEHFSIRCLLAFSMLAFHVMIASSQQTAGKCVRGDCKNGYGMIAFPNKDTLSGYFADGKIDYGNYSMNDPYYPVRSLYTGRIDSLKPNGFGMITNAFHTYRGNFKEGLMHGQGSDTVYFGNLKMYKGEFFQGQFIRGTKLEFDANYQSSKYVGEFKDFMPHGNVAYYYHDRLEYEGDFFEGKYHGKGKVYRNGKILYEGDLVMGVMDGKGKMYENGELVYEGDVVMGEKQGTGTLFHYDPSTKEVIAVTGNLKDGKHTGTVSVKKAGLLYYEGEWSNNQPKGKGILYTDSGTVAAVFDNLDFSGPGNYRNKQGNLVYEGSFANGYYAGEGTLYRPDGSRFYTGTFEDGTFHGKGILYLDKGDVFEGGFQRGIPVKGTYQKKGKGKKKNVVYMEGKFKNQ